MLIKILLLLSFCLVQGNYFILSDIHLDVYYNENYNEATRCHSTPINKRPGIPTQSKTQQRLGRVGCDPPLSLLDSALAQMHKIDPNPEFLLVTGDFIGHYVADSQDETGVFNVTKNQEHIFQSFSDMTNSFQKYFPTTQVIPVVGNNDGFQDYQVLSSVELNGVAGAWRSYLNETQLYSFMRGGFYTTTSRDGQNFIVLASTAYSPYAEQNDLAQHQLEWLLKQLMDFQKANQTVTIAMHAPPGQSPYRLGQEPTWNESSTQIFLYILFRFKDTIQQVLTGHWHHSSILLSHVPIIANPGLSPVHGDQPGFRYRKSQTWEDWVIDLDSGDWSLLYDFEQQWKLEGLDFDGLYSILQSSDDAVNQYLFNCYGKRPKEMTVDELWQLQTGVEGYVNPRLVLCQMKYIIKEKFDNCLNK